MVKLYAILARDADRAVIFRRGPTRHVCLIAWDLKKDVFEPGQWFKGRLYERKADLSPDGTKLVYMAGKFTGPIGTWTAVSKPPYLTALVLWRCFGTWDDLSLFETNSVLALARYRSDSTLEPAEGFGVPHQLRVRCKPWPGHFHVLADHDRMIRDGWHVHGGDPIYRGGASANLPTYRRPLPGKPVPGFLQLSTGDRQAGDSGVSYALCGMQDEVVPLDADWADVHRRDVLYARGGAMWRMRVARGSGGTMIRGEAVELADFTDMHFQSVISPIEARKW